MTSFKFCTVLSLVATAAGTPSHYHIWNGGCTGAGVVNLVDHTDWQGCIGVDGCAEKCWNMNYHYFMVDDRSDNCICAHKCVSEGNRNFRAYAVGEWTQEYCVDRKITHRFDGSTEGANNFCSEWCNSESGSLSGWGNNCDTHCHNDYCCKCTGCNGCEGGPTAAPTQAPTRLLATELDEVDVILANLSVAAHTAQALALLDRSEEAAATLRAAIVTVDEYVTTVVRATRSNESSPRNPCGDEGDDFNCSHQMSAVVDLRDAAHTMRKALMCGLKRSDDHGMDDVLRWSTGNTGVRAQLQDKVAELENLEQARNVFEAQQALSTDIHAAVREIEANVDARLVQVDQDVRNNGLALDRVRLAQREILNVAQQTLTQTTANAKMLKKIEANTHKSTLDKVLGYVQTAVSIASGLCGMPGNIAAMPKQFGMIAGMFRKGGRLRRDVSMNKTATGLVAVADAVADFDSAFGRTSSPGWDVNRDGIAQRDEMIDLQSSLGNISMPKEFATMLDQLPTWRSLFNANITGTDNATTFGRFVAVALQAQSQPFRAELMRLHQLWNGLLIALKPSMALADALAPTPNVTCYGVNASVVLASAHACAARFPASCSQQGGFGLWPHGDDVICQMDIHELVSAIATSIPAAHTAIASIQRDINSAMSETVEWIQDTSGLQNLPASPDPAAFRLMIEKTSYIENMTSNTRAAARGSLWDNLGEDGPADPKHARIADPVLETLAVADLARIRSEAYAESLLPLLASSVAAETAWQSELAWRYKTAAASFAQWRNRTTQVPPCLIQGQQVCADGDLMGARKYVEQAKSTAAIEALDLFARTRKAFLYQSVDPAYLASNSFTSSITSDLNVHGFHEAITSADRTWDMLSQHLGAQGESMLVQFEVRRSDQPHAFQVLERTGIFQVHVPWPMHPRERRAKLLNQDVRAFFPFPSSKSGVQVRTQITKGNYSIFYPVEDRPPMTFFPVNLGNAVSDFEYEADTCDAIRGVCIDRTCEADSYLTQSPYGDWTIKVTANTVNGALPPSIFQNVTGMRLVFHVWYYAANFPAQDYLFTDSNPCGAQCGLTPDTLDGTSMCRPEPTSAPTVGPTFTPSTSPTAGPTATLSASPTTASPTTDPCRQILCSAACNVSLSIDGDGDRDGLLSFACGWDTESSACRTGFTTSAAEVEAMIEAVPGACNRSSTTSEGTPEAQTTASTFLDRSTTPSVATPTEETQTTAPLFRTTPSTATATEGSTQALSAYSCIDGACIPYARGTYTGADCGNQCSKAQSSPTASTDINRSQDKSSSDGLTQILTIAGVVIGVCLLVVGTVFAFRRPSKFGTQKQVVRNPMYDANDADSSFGKA